MVFYPDEMWWEWSSASPVLHVEIYGAPAPGPTARPRGLLITGHTAPSDPDFPSAPQSVPENAAVKKVCAHLRGNWTMLEGEDAQLAARGTPGMGHAQEQILECHPQ